MHGRYDEADAIVKQLEANGSEPIDAAAKADTSGTRNVGGRSLGICLLVVVVAVAATNVCSYAFTSWVPDLYRERNYRWLPAHDVPVRAYGFLGGCVRSGTVRHQGPLPLRRLRERRGQAAQCVDAYGGGVDAHLAWCYVHLCGH